MGWDWFEALTSTLAVADPLGSLIPGHRVRHDAGDFREGAGPGKPPARICQGGAELAELLDHDPNIRSPRGANYLVCSIACRGHCREWVGR
jgi:hypothetical protein